MIPIAVAIFKGAIDKSWRSAGVDKSSETRDASGDNQAMRLRQCLIAKTGQTCFRTFINSRWDCARGSSSGVRGHARGQFFTSWEHPTGVAEPPDFHDATDHNVVDGKIANIDPIVNIPSGRIQTCRPASTISCSPEKTASCDMRV